MVYLKVKMMYNKISEFDYERIEYRKNSNHDSFKIKTGQWTGTVITYGEVVMQEPLDTTQQAKMKFQYQIEETPLDAKVIEKDPDFNNYVGDMLHHIIETALELNNYKIGDMPDGTESANDNIEEFNQQ